RPSLVLKASHAGVPRWKNELKGGWSKGWRNIQYSPPNGITSLRASAAPDPWGTGNGSIRAGTACSSGHRITPGKVPGINRQTNLVSWIADQHPRTRCVLMSALDIECKDCPLAGRCLLLLKPFVPSEAVEMITS